MGQSEQRVGRYLVDHCQIALRGVEAAFYAVIKYNNNEEIQPTEEFEIQEVFVEWGKTIRACDHAFAQVAIDEALTTWGGQVELIRADAMGHDLCKADPDVRAACNERLIKKYNV